MKIFRSELKKVLDEMTLVSLDYINTNELENKIQSLRNVKKANDMVCCVPDGICIPNPQLSDITKLGLYIGDTNIILYPTEFTTNNSCTFDTMPVLEQYAQKIKNKYVYKLVAKKVSELVCGDIIYNPYIPLFGTDNKPNTNAIHDNSNYTFISKIEQLNNKSQIQIYYMIPTSRYEYYELPDIFDTNSLVYVVTCTENNSNNKTNNTQNTKPNNTQNTKPNNNQQSKNVNIGNKSNNRPYIGFDCDIFTDIENFLRV